MVVHMDPLGQEKSSGRQSSELPDIFSLHMLTASSYRGRKKNSEP